MTLVCQQTLQFVPSRAIRYQLQLSPLCLLWIPQIILSWYYFPHLSLCTSPQLRGALAQTQDSPARRLASLTLDHFHFHCSLNRPHISQTYPHHCNRLSHSSAPTYPVVPRDHPLLISPPTHSCISTSQTNKYFCELKNQGSQ